MTGDLRTATPHDAERWERAHSPEVGRNEDAEPDHPFTMPLVSTDVDTPLARAIRNHFGGDAA